MLHGVLPHGDVAAVDDDMPERRALGAGLGVGGRGRRQGARGPLRSQLDELAQQLIARGVRPQPLQRGAREPLRVTQLYREINLCLMNVKCSYGNDFFKYAKISASLYYTVQRNI